MARRWMGIVLVALVGAFPGHSGTGPKSAPKIRRAAPPPRHDAAGDVLPPGVRWRLGSPRLVAEGALDFLAFSPDGKWLLSGGEQLPLTLWDAATGKRQTKLAFPTIHAKVGLTTMVIRGRAQAIQLHQVVVQAPLVAMAGKLCFFCDDKGNGHLLDVSVPKILRTWMMGEKQPHAVTLSPGGLLAWTTGDGEVVLFHPLGKDSAQRRKLDPLGIIQMALSPDGKYLASTHPDNTVLLSEVKSGKRLRRYPVANTPSTFLGFSADSQTLIASDPQSVHFFEVDSIDERFTVTEQDTLLDQVAWVSPGKTVATLHSSGVVHVWDITTGKSLRKLTIEEKKRLPELPNETTCFACSADGRHLATGNALGQIDVWDGQTGKQVLPAKPREAILTVGFDFTGKRLIVVYPNGVKQYAVSDGSLRQFHKRAIDKNSEVALAPGGQILGMKPNNVFTAIDIGSGKKLPSLALPALAAEGSEIQRFLFHPDGKHVLIGRGDPQLFLFELATGKQQASYPVNHLGSPLLISDDGRTLYLVVNGHLKGWEMATGKQRCSVNIHQRTPMDVSINGQQFALGNFSDLYLMDASQGGTLKMLTRRPEKTCTFANFSPDGEWLAAGGNGQGFFLWEARTGRRRVHRPDGTRHMTRLVFSPTGKEFLTTSDDGSLLVWDLAEVLRTGAEKPAPLPVVRAMAKLWAELASEDGTRAEEAIREMVQNADFERFMARHLKAVPAVAPEAIAHLIASLEADTATVRDAAHAQLATLEEQARVALERAAKGNGAETRLRAGRLLARLRPFGQTGAQARPLRAIEALERRGSPAARRLLAELALGAPEVPQTREAIAALDRLRIRISTEP